MEFVQGARVHAADGREVGRVDRVVIEPKDRSVTYLVIRQGLLFTEDKVLPIGMVDRAEGDKVFLRADADLDALRPFEVKQYVPAPEAQAGYAEALYYYPAAGGYLQQPVMREIDVVHTERSIPDTAIALKEGSPVLSADGQDVGRVERVLTDPESEQVTHFTVERGLLSKARKLIPNRWVEEFDDQEVHLLVDASTVERLPEYEG